MRKCCKSWMERSYLQDQLEEGLSGYLLLPKPQRVAQLVGNQQLKDSSSSPIAVGFGISDVKHIEQVREWGADGAIVGSALVKRIANASIEMKVEEAGSFCKELRAATN